MDITPLLPKGRLIINRYGNGGFMVNDQRFDGNILILADRILAWETHDFGHAKELSFASLLKQIPTPEIVLIGTGSQFAPLPPSLRDYFRKAHISADPMDTGAACRTYNVLVSEDRRVAAALIAVG